MDRGPAESEETLGIIRRAYDGDRQAFDQLFARHRAYLRQVVELRLDPNVRRRVDPSDVVQEAQLEAARRLGTYLDQPEIPFRLWLRQITYDQMLTAWRRLAHILFNTDRPWPLIPYPPSSSSITNPSPSRKADVGPSGLEPGAGTCRWCRGR